MIQDIKEATSSKATKAGLPKTPEETKSTPAQNGNRRAKQNPKKEVLKSKASKIIYWASINIIVINMIVYLLFLTYWSKGSLTVHSANRVLLLMGISLGVLCLILWVGHVTSINEIGSFVAKAIWGTFIVSVLTTVTMEHRSASNTPEQNHITLEKVRLLDETYIRPSGHKVYLDQFVDKPNDIFVLKPSFQFALFITASGYSKDDSGHCSVVAEVALTNGLKQIVSCFPVVRDEEEWIKANIAQHLPREQLNALIELNKDKLVFIGIFDTDGIFCPNDSQVRTLTLTVTVKDLLNQSYDEEKQLITIK